MVWIRKQISYIAVSHGRAHLVSVTKPQHTGDRFWPLEDFIRMEVTGRQRKIDTNKQQE